MHEDNSSYHFNLFVANERNLDFSDDKLVKMTTSELRLLLEHNRVSPEQHRELRIRRRRLQNRKYARRCARKKQTEVNKLTLEVEEEVTEVQVIFNEFYQCEEKAGCDYRMLYYWIHN